MVSRTAIALIMVGLVGLVVLSRHKDMAWLVDARELFKMLGTSRTHVDSRSQEDRAYDARRERVRALVQGLKLRLELRAAGRACALPAVPDGARVMLVNGYGGLALSTLALDSQDAVTSVDDLEIEPGDEPLYIIASSYGPTIWRVAGATARVKTFIAASFGIDGKTSAGVIGIDRRSVKFTTSACAPSLSDAERILRNRLPSADKPQVADPIASAVSATKRIYRMMYGFEASITPPSGGPTHFARLPGAIDFEPISQAGRVLWKRAMQMHPGGVVAIDPASVVASGQVEPYETLPEEAGFAQLVENGTLKAMEWRNAYVDGDGDGAVMITGRDIGRTPDFRVPLGFRVLKPMRMPAHPAIYSIGDPLLYVEDGVPVPEGDPGGACIMSAADGSTLKGRPCSDRRLGRNR